MCECVGMVRVCVRVFVTRSDSKDESFPVGLSGRAFRAAGRAIPPNQGAVGILKGNSYAEDTSAYDRRPAAHA